MFWCKNPRFVWKKVGIEEMLKEKYRVQEREKELKEGKKREKKEGRIYSSFINEI